MIPRTLALVGLMACGPCLAEPFEPWTPKDTGLQLAYTALHLADWAQTRAIAGSQGAYVEKNRLLGPTPSQVRVNRYMAASLAAHWAITAALPSAYRPYWQGGTIAVEAWCVGRNARLGIRMKF